MCFLARVLIVIDRVHWARKRLTCNPPRLQPHSVETTKGKSGLSDDILKRAQQFISVLPHSMRLGMDVLSAGQGRAEMRMPYTSDLVGDPRTGVIFGGAVSALMDSCAGLSVFAHPDASVMMATLDLRIDYMRSAVPGQDIIAKAHCHHVTHHVAFVTATAFDDDLSRPVASANGAFALNRDEKGIA